MLTERDRALVRAVLLEENREFHFLLKDETIQSDENLFISSGQEVAFRDLTVKGVCINRGYALARTLKIDGGKVIIDGGTFAINGELV